MHITPCFDAFSEDTHTEHCLPSTAALMRAGADFGGLNDDVGNGLGVRDMAHGRCAKRNRQNDSGEPEELKKAPHSFVMHRGPVGKYIHVLTTDFRRVMEPFTASSLKARRKNKIKDFVSVSGPLRVSHMCLFTQTEQSPYLKIIRLPRGPTLTFKIHNYSIARDIVSVQKKPHVVAKSFRHSPLVVLNSFSGEGMQLKVMASMFQNMFPTINVRKVNLNTIRRCVLLNYNPVSKLIDFRHYSIKVLPVGVSKGVKKIIQSKVPNLGQLSDISEFLTKSQVLSESEFEDDPASHVILPHDLASRGNIAATKSGIRVYELGPRMTLQVILFLESNLLHVGVQHWRFRLMKIEDGLLTGEVLFHELYHLTEEEKLAIQKNREKKRKLKEKRRKVQEDNKKKKELLKEEHKKKSLKGMKLPKKEEEAVVETVEKSDVEEDDDDVEWYKKEVGEEPDKAPRAEAIRYVSASITGDKNRVVLQQSSNKQHLQSEVSHSRTPLEAYKPRILV
ncbi:hypothetical protein PR048_032332 [Dryococelus australis]|uniref:Brix domain-containing protein n=1 Tax=Dryococelus australis TaxID=614101 RepID=A0ABQ9G619_9NEOP|nr:hypothetical protein PR048_032332 [Dryococelus australis]